MEADDTVIFSENTVELQNARNVFQEYCTTWKLTRDITKTRILIISKGRPSLNQHFLYNSSSEIEIVSEYIFLGHLPLKKCKLQNIQEVYR